MVVKSFMAIANEAVAKNNALRAVAGAKAGEAHFDTGFTFMNAYYEIAGVTKPFTTIESVRDLRIRLPGQAQGIEGPDRGVLVGNADGQRIYVSTEFKTRGAKGELKRQLATRDDRLFGGEEITEKTLQDFDAYFVSRPKITPQGGTFQIPKNEGTKLTYTIEGQIGIQQVDFENIILLRDARNAELSLPTDYLTKIGVAAGKRGSIKKATDAKGGEYVRIIVPVETDELRRVIIEMLRNESWQ